MFSNDFGNFIYQLRKEKGFTQQELANLINVSNKTISKWEKGRGLPDVTLFPIIANIFEISIDELIQGYKNKKIDNKETPEELKIKISKLSPSKAYSKLSLSQQIFIRQKVIKGYKQMVIKRIALSLAIILFISFFVFTILMNNGTIKSDIFSKEKDFITEEYENGVSIKSVSTKIKNSSSVIIPDTIKNKKVLSIGKFSFCNSNLREIELGKYVENIEYASFQNCNFLSTVKLNQGLKVIHKEAFYNCTSLYEINFPSSLKNVGDYAFCNNISLFYTKLSNIEYFGDGCFYNSGLSNILYLDNAKEIGITAFGKTNIQRVEINNIKKIKCGAFYSCLNLDSINSTSINIELEKELFGNCLKLNNININKEILDKYPECFSFYPLIKKIELKNETINDNTCFENKFLESITIKNTVKHINENCFSYLDSLEEIIIPESVESIGNHSFHMLSNLKKATFLGNPTLSEYGLFEIRENNTFIINKNLTVYCKENTNIHNFCKQKGINFILIP